MRIRFLYDTLIAYVSRAGKASQLLMSEGRQAEVVALHDDLFDPIYTHVDYQDLSRFSCRRAAFEILERKA